MAAYTTDDLVYILEIEQKHLDFLGVIRHWENLKIASCEQYYLVKDFTPSQIESTELKGIPFKQLYYLSDGKLFPLGALLPLKKIPSTLLWTPIAKGLKVSLPSFNHNYFGIDQTISFKLIHSELERESKAMLVEMNKLKLAISTIPKIRFKTLEWVVVDDKALIIGTPLLPIQGETFWLDKNVLIPTGYEFDKQALSDMVMNKIADKNSLIVWSKDSNYFLVNKYDLEIFSLSSFRLTDSYGAIGSVETL